MNEAKLKSMKKLEWSEMQLNDLQSKLMNLKEYDKDIEMLEKYISFDTIEEAQEMVLKYQTRMKT